MQQLNVDRLLIPLLWAEFSCSGVALLQEVTHHVDVPWLVRGFHSGAPHRSALGGSLGASQDRRKQPGSLHRISLATEDLTSSISARYLSGLQAMVQPLVSC